jgi:class 3 adenylate cyclase
MRAGFGVNQLRIEAEFVDLGEQATADVVGYSRMMGVDEAGTAKIVRERREAATPIVRLFGGRLVKTMGDGVLLEFPSVVAAVECAIAIQQMMAEHNTAIPEVKRILYRVGVNLGDILIDGEDILGDGVNVAARLEGICEPGGICLSEDAYRQAHGRAQEYCPTGARVCANAEGDRGREGRARLCYRVGKPIACARAPRSTKVAGALCTEKARGTCSTRCRTRRAAHRDRGWRVVVPEREPGCVRCVERASTACNPTPFDRGVAVR